MTLGFGDEEEEYRLILGPRNAEKLGKFGTLDIRIRQIFPIKRGLITAFFELTNATNRNVEC